MKFIFGKPTDNPFDREEEIRALSCNKVDNDCVEKTIKEIV
jgi:hypothetical protein